MPALRKCRFGTCRQSEAKDFVKIAYEISEEFDDAGHAAQQHPYISRPVTVTLAERQDIPIRPTKRIWQTGNDAGSPGRVMWRWKQDWRN